MKFPFLRRAPKPVLTGRKLQSRPVLPEHARILRSVNQRMMRMYEAAISNNLNADFPVSITSANAEILTSISPTRSRARRLERDNPYARSILETFQNNVGGDEPFRLEMKVGKCTDDGQFILEKDTNRLIEEAWCDAGLPENCTVRRDMSRLEVDIQAITAIVRDGGILARHWRAFPNNKFRYAIEPIEIDRLDHYWNRPQVNTANEIQFSIEMDQWHGPVAYHILSKHPGDVFAWSNQPRYRERVPAEDIIALFDLRTRAGQYVGMPRFASIIQRLHRIDQFDIAHVTAAIWAACKPFFIIQEFPTAMGEMVPDFIKRAMESASDDQGMGQGEGEKLSTSEPGTGEVLPYGQKPFLVDPKFPIEAAADFKKDNLRAAAAGSGAAYHIIGQDLESVNFSSGRIGLEAFRDTCKVLQRHFVLGYRRPHFNEWLKSAILSGQLALPIARLEEFQRAAKFYGRRWQYIQPLQDAQADQLRLQIRTTSRDRIIAESERGGDYEEVASELASDAAVDEAHGLDPFEAKPKPAAPGGGNDDGQTEKEKKPEPENNGNGKLRSRLTFA